MWKGGTLKHAIGRSGTDWEIGRCRGTGKYRHRHSRVWAILGMATGITLGLAVLGAAGKGACSFASGILLKAIRQNSRHFIAYFVLSGLPKT
jgi:F0F1-type ATP synthase membrane subunit c/vacuolar-type H+-ATPase subunit K